MYSITMLSLSLLLFLFLFFFLRLSLPSSFLSSYVFVCLSLSLFLPFSVYRLSFFLRLSPLHGAFPLMRSLYDAKKSLARVSVRRATDFIVGGKLRVIERVINGPPLDIGQ